MIAAAVFAFGPDEEPARRLALELAVPFGLVSQHVFPDGESLPSVSAASRTAILYRQLDRPDAKLMPLLLAADALRRHGAKRLVLVAPYMPYLRQDRVFVPGQPLSRGVIGELLGRAFDRIVTVQAHLHRTHDLGSSFQGAAVDNLQTASLIAKAEWPDDLVVVAPDVEASPWARDLAQSLGAPWTAFNKERRGDDRVTLTLDNPDQIIRKQVLMIDDIVSTGGTAASAAKLLIETGARTVDLVVVHALFDQVAARKLAAAGVRRVLSTDSVRHPSNHFGLTTLLAQALRQELAP